MKLSVFSLIMPKYSLEDVMRKLSELGYDGVEWRVHPDYHLHPDHILKEAERVKRLTEEAGIEIPALSPYLGIDESERLENIFKAASIMGAKGCRVCAPGYDRRRDYNEIYEDSLSHLERIQKIARRYGVKALLEVHMGNIMPSAGLAHRLVYKFDPECIGVIYDPGNMVYEGMENWRMGLELLGAYLGHVHVKNAIWEKGEKRPDGYQAWKAKMVPLPEGIVDWKQLVDDLRSVGYDGYLSLEDLSDLSSEVKICEGIKILRRLGV